MSEMVKMLRTCDGRDSCIDCPYLGTGECDGKAGKAADAIETLERELKDCRNELCLKCGEYKRKHLGACDGCRWREDHDTQAG